MKKTAGFFAAENLKNPLMGKRNQNACVMRAKITYTQKHINVISNLNKRKLQKLYRITENKENGKKYLLNLKKSAILTP